MCAFCLMNKNASTQFLSQLDIMHEDRLVFQYVYVCVDYNHYIDKVKNTFMNTTDVQHFFVLDSRLFCE